MDSKMGKNVDSPKWDEQRGTANGPLVLPLAVWFKTMQQPSIRLETHLTNTRLPLSYLGEMTISASFYFICCDACVLLGQASLTSNPRANQLSLTRVHWRTKVECGCDPWT